MTQASQIWDKAVQKAGVWVKELADDLSWRDMSHTLHALRSVLHALRDRLPVDEAAQLAAQLPLLIKGVYYDGWDPSRTPVSARSKEEFLALVTQPLQRVTPDAEPERVTRAVFRLLASHVSRGEILDVRGILPQELLDLWPEHAAV